MSNGLWNYYFYLSFIAAISNVPMEHITIHSRKLGVYMLFLLIFVRLNDSFCHTKCAN